MFMVCTMYRPNLLILYQCTPQAINYTVAFRVLARMTAQVITNKITTSFLSHLQSEFDLQDEYKGLM